MSAILYSLGRFPLERNLKRIRQRLECLLFFPGVSEFASETWKLKGVQLSSEFAKRRTNDRGWNYLLFRLSNKSTLPVWVSIPLRNLLRIPQSGNTLSEFADAIADAIADEFVDKFAEDFTRVETGLTLMKPSSLSRNFSIKPLSFKPPPLLSNPRRSQSFFNHLTKQACMLMFCMVWEKNMYGIYAFDS